MNLYKLRQRTNEVRRKNKLLLTKKTKWYSPLTVSKNQGLAEQLQRHLLCKQGSRRRATPGYRNFLVTGISKGVKKKKTTVNSLATAFARLQRRLDKKVQRLNKIRSLTRVSISVKERLYNQLRAIQVDYLRQASKNMRQLDSLHYKTKLLQLRSKITVSRAIKRGHQKTNRLASRRKLLKHKQQRFRRRLLRQIAVIKGRPISKTRRGRRRVFRKIYYTNWLRSKWNTLSSLRTRLAGAERMRRALMRYLASPVHQTQVVHEARWQHAKTITHFKSSTSAKTGFLKVVKVDKDIVLNKCINIDYKTLIFYALQSIVTRFLALAHSVYLDWYFRWSHVLGSNLHWASGLTKYGWFYSAIPILETATLSLNWLLLPHSFSKTHFPVTLVASIGQKYSRYLFITAAETLKRRYLSWRKIQIISGVFAAYCLVWSRFWKRLMLADAILKAKQLHRKYRPRKFYVWLQRFRLTRRLQGFIRREVTDLFWHSNQTQGLNKLNSIKSRLFNCINNKNTLKQRFAVKRGVIKVILRDKVLRGAFLRTYRKRLADRGRPAFKLDRKFNRFLFRNERLKRRQHKYNRRLVKMAAYKMYDQRWRYLAMLRQSYAVRKLLHDLHGKNYFQAKTMQRLPPILCKFIRQLSPQSIYFKFMHGDKNVKRLERITWYKSLDTAKKFKFEIKKIARLRLPGQRTAFHKFRYNLGTLLLVRHFLVGLGAMEWWAKFKRKRRHDRHSRWVKLKTADLFDFDILEPREQ